MKRSKFAIVMHTATFVSAVLIVVFTCLHFCTEHGCWFPLAITCGTTFYHFGMRLLVGSLVPNRFCWQSNWFRSFPWEQKLYKRLGLKTWKRTIPSYNPTLFSMKDYSLEQIIAHMCQAEVVHEIIVVCSFLPIFFSLVVGDFPVFLITSLLAAGFDLIFVLLQRFNRPRLVRILLTKERSSGNV